MIGNSIIRIAAAAAGALLIGAGCTARLDPAVEAGGEAIGFSAGSALLRDDATKAPLESRTTFGVFAFYQPGTPGAPGAWNGSRTPDFMFNVPVYYDGSAYTYSPVRFWPARQNTLSFWAYCPYEENPDFIRSGRSEAYTSTTPGVPDIRFSVSDGTVDLMTSDILKSLTSAVGTVQFTFHHALSLIDIRVNKQDPESKFTVKLKSVRLDGLYLTGKLNNSSGWGSLADDGSFTVFSGNKVLAETPSYDALDGVMLIPQNLEREDAKLRVEFSLTPVGGGTERTAASEVLLSEVFEDSSAVWEKNKHYTLTLTIAPDDPIAFSVEWSDWGDVYNWHITS